MSLLYSFTVLLTVSTVVSDIILKLSNYLLEQIGKLKVTYA